MKPMVLISESPRSRVYSNEKHTDKVRIHSNNFGEIERETYWLKRMASWNRVPKFVLRSETFIRMEYRGRPLNSYNMPVDAEKQIAEILNGLVEYKCNHNSITESELLVKDGFISLVDFEWATELGTKVPPEWPEEVGSGYLLNGARNDAYALRQSLEKAKGIK